MDSEPLDYDAFLLGLGLLTTNFPPRAATEEQGDALLSAWWLVLERKRWITAAIFDRAVSETLATIKGFLPSVAEFIAICEFCKGELEREAERTRPALPPPTQRPKSTRPSNAYLLRNIAIGKLRYRHGPLLSENGFNIDSHPFTEAQIAAVLAEMKAKDEFSRLWEMSPQASDQEVLAAMGAGVGAGPRQFEYADFDKIPEVPRPGVTKVQWKDGRVSEIVKRETSRTPFEERQQRAKEELRDTRPANWLECLCGVQVLEYRDGRRTTVDGRPHYCKWTTLAQQERKGHRSAPRPSDAWDMTERAATAAGEEPPF